MIGNFYGWTPKSQSCTAASNTKRLFFAAGNACYKIKFRSFVVSSTKKPGNFCQRSNIWLSTFKKNLARFRVINIKFVSRLCFKLSNGFFNEEEIAVENIPNSFFRHRLIAERISI